MSFGKKNTLREIYDFLHLKEVNCIEPENLTESILKDRINEFINQWNEKNENIKVMKKLKELTK